MQLVINPTEYFKSATNYNDMLRVGFFFSYYIIRIYYNNDIEGFLITTMILSWIRGITIFALFQSTRYMISLIREVLKDIIPFASVVLYSIIAFVFIDLTFTDETQSLGFRILYSYFDAIGNITLDDKETNILRIVTVVLASIFNLTIMMNLLISILSTVYDRVNDDSVVENMKQLTNLIIEAEYFMFCKRKEKKKCILQICEEYNPPEIIGENEIRARFKNVRTELSIILKKTEKLQKQTETIDDNMITNKDTTVLKIENLRKELIADMRGMIEESTKQL